MTGCSKTLLLPLRTWRIPLSSYPIIGIGTGALWVMEVGQNGVVHLLNISCNLLVSFVVLIPVSKTCFVVSLP